MRPLFVVLLAACAGAPAPAPRDRAPSPPGDADRHFAIWLGGARIGTAHETERWTAAGVALRRTEALRFLRGDAEVAIETEIEIAAAPDLSPSHVTWRERAQRTRQGAAHRTDAGWTVRDDDGERALAAAAIPAELAPLVIRRDGRFAGSVFLPARGFALGTGSIEPIDADARDQPARRLIARLALAGGAIAEATIDLGDDAMPARVVDGDGVIATRITSHQAAAAFPVVDLIAATALPLSGPRGDRLLLTADLADLAHVGALALPGQAARPAPDGVELELSPELPGALPRGPRGPDRTADLRRIVARVRRQIAPDLGASPSSPRAAAHASAGDCTTFALAYAALASARAIPTRVVTGFRIDGERLVRHRWAVSWTGRAWIAVDPAFGAAPAGGDLIGVAVHDADDAGLVTGEAALTRVRAAAWR